MPRSPTGCAIPPADRRISLGNRPRRPGDQPHRDADHPQGLAGTGGRGRRDRAVELPVRGHHQQARPGAGHRQHRGAQAGAEHAVQRDPPRPADRRKDRHPGRCRQRRHRIGSLRRRGAHAVAEGRPDLVHRLDGRRQADHGKGRGDHEAAVPRTRRQVGHHRARRRRLRDGLRDRHRAVHARRAGLRQPDPDAAAAVPLRRGGGDPQEHVRKRHAGRSPGPRNPVRSGDLGETARTRARLHQKGRRRGRHGAGRRPERPQDSTRDSTSGQRCSSTSTTP